MLNELYDLKTSMERAGIAKPSWHNHYKVCPKYRTFLLLVASDGTLSDLEPIKDVDRITEMRRYEVANGRSFPAFNLSPLLHAQNDKARKAVKALKEAVKAIGKEKNRQGVASQVDQLWEVCNPLWSRSEEHRIKKCLQSAGLKDKLGDAIQNAPQDYRAIKELMDRIRELTVDDLQISLKRLLKERILASQDANDWIDNLLVSSAKKPRKASLVLELADRSLFPYPVNHPAVRDWINAQLMQELGTATVQRSAPEQDAFGEPIQQADSGEKFPSVNLPGIGKASLRAMSGEIPCQKRYGRIDAQSFRAGRSVRQSMKDALEWIGHRGREGRTWADASGACGFTKKNGKTVPVRGLFLVYPSSLGDTPPELAGFFVREKGAVDQDGTKFEAAATRVTSALRTMVDEQPNVEVRVFVLAKADKARTKVVVSKNYDAHALISGAAAWQEGCKNLPQIKLNVSAEESPVWITPLSPFPTEVVECLSVAWLEGGSRTDQVHGLRIGEGIDLLLETPASARKMSKRALSLAVRNLRPLVLALGHADHRGDGILRLYAQYKRHPELVPAILGLLLYKENIEKGAYMHRPLFLVGRLLALADLLHKEYCKHVRGNKIPPQLIGNALMTSAVDNPQRGMARLLERLKIYQAWANTGQGDGVGLAKWVLRQMGIVSSELAAHELPDRTDDADKAQMLLGYLARVEDDPS